MVGSSTRGKPKQEYQVQDEIKEGRKYTEVSTKQIVGLRITRLRKERVCSVLPIAT